METDQFGILFCFTSADHSAESKLSQLSLSLPGEMLDSEAAFKFCSRERSHLTGSRTKSGALSYQSVTLHALVEFRFI